MLSGKLFTSESMCHDSYQLAYKCCQLKNALKIHSTRFCNYAINVRLNKSINPVKIFHIVDTEKLFGIGNLDNLLATPHFTCFISFYLVFSCSLPILTIFYKYFLLIMLSLFHLGYAPILLDSKTLIFIICKLINHEKQ